ncbi:MAG: helix-turn-helix transcriptional regulator [Rhodopseudomonas palustris]|nr:helix-turn-helix transcriptional regulator [Rhodopseudomonas palustris]
MLQTDRRVLSGALDALSIHTIILDRSGHCSHVSPQAKMLLSQSEGSDDPQGSAAPHCHRRARHRRLSMRRRPDRHRSRSAAVPWLRDAISCDSRYPIRRPARWPVTGDDGLCTHLRLSPIPVGGAERRRHGAAALLVIEPPSISNAAELQPSAAMLLTAAERAGGNGNC